MDSASQQEVRTNIGDLLGRVAAGETILVTDDGVPAAVLVPPGMSVRTRLAAVGRLRVGTGLDLSVLRSPVPPT